MKQFIPTVAFATAGVALGWASLSSNSGTAIPSLSPELRVETVTTYDSQSKPTLTAGSPSIRDGRSNESDDIDPHSVPFTAVEAATRTIEIAKLHLRRPWERSGSLVAPRIGFEKKLEIQVSSQTFVVGHKDVAIEVTNGEVTEGNLDDIVASIDRAVEAWGEPPWNFYWVPCVDFIVQSGGKENCDRLRALLKDDLGVASTVKYAANDRKSDKR